MPPRRTTSSTAPRSSSSADVSREVAGSSRRTSIGAWRKVKAKADALPLTHREAVDPQLADLCEIEARVAIAHRGCSRAGVEKRQPRPQVEVALHRHARVEPPVAGRQEADLALVGAAFIAQPYPREVHAAAFGGHQPSDDPQQRGLAGAVAPRDQGDVPAVQFEVQIVERRLGATRPSLAQPFDLEQRIGDVARRRLSRAGTAAPERSSSVSGMRVAVSSQGGQRQRRWLVRPSRSGLSSPATFRWRASRRRDPRGALTRGWSARPAAAVDRRWRSAHPHTLLERRLVDGSVGLSVERDEEIGFRIWAPRHGCYLVTPDGRRVIAAPPSGPAWRWERLVLAQVLPLAAVLRGMHVLHASAVALAGRAVAFMGRSGVGKTTLAGRIVAHGARLMTDDVLAVDDVQVRSGPTAAARWRASTPESCGR